MNDEQAHGIVSEPNYHARECVETRGTTRARMHIAVGVKCCVTLEVTQTMTEFAQASSAGSRATFGECR